MVTLSVYLERTEGIAGWFIRLVEGTKANHVWTSLELKLGGVTYFWIADISDGNTKARLVGFQTYQNHIVRKNILSIITRPVSEDVLDSDKLHGLKFKRYSMRQNIGVFIKRGIHKFLPFFKDKNGVNCTEASYKFIVLCLPECEDKTIDPESMGIQEFIKYIDKDFIL